MPQLFVAITKDPARLPGEMPLNHHHLHREEAETPGQMTGKEFEARIMGMAEKLQTRGDLMLCRYGTTSSFFNGRMTAKDSLPDFEGVTSMGLQFIIEAKATSQDLLNLNTKFVKPRQIRHMAERSRFNVPCFVLVHHYGRELATRNVPPITKAYPVHYKMEWVVAVLAAAKKKEEPHGSIPHDMGFEVPWLIGPRWKLAGPDLVDAIEKTRHHIYDLNSR